MNSLRELSEDEIRDMSREEIFSRGYDYYTKGRVLGVAVIGSVVMAEVRGRSSSPYSVKIEKEGDDLRSSCTCPYGGFCKHRVAVLLSLTKDDDIVTKIPAERIRRYLSTKSRGELVDTIWNYASSDMDFMRSLLTEVQREARDIDLSYFRNEIDRRLSEAWSVEYPDVSRYAIELEKFAERIRGFADEGSGKEASELLFYFLKSSIKTFENSGIDDSSGSFGMFVIDLGNLCAEALKASEDKDVFPVDDFVDIRIKAADYGLEDGFDSILRELPEKTLLSAERVTRERVEEAVGEGEEFWESRDERFLLVTILALLGSKGKYTELCNEWGVEEWITELESIQEKEGGDPA